MSDLSERIWESFRQADLVAAERPTGEQMGESLELLASMTRTAMSLDRDREAQRVAQRGLDVSDLPLKANSQASQDRTLLDDSVDLQEVRHPHEAILGDLVILLDSATENLVALGHLMRCTNLVRPPISVARAALEAAAVAFHLLDTEPAPRERLARQLSWRLSVLTESAKEAGDPADPENWATQERDWWCALAMKLGYSVEFERQRHRPPRVGPRISTQELVEDLLQYGLGKDAWRSMSNLVHGRESMMLLGGPPMFANDSSYSQYPRDVARVTLPALFATFELIPRVAAYFDWDLSVPIEHAEFVVRTWFRGAGHEDGLIRESLGLEFP